MTGLIRWIAQAALRRLTDKDDAALAVRSPIGELMTRSQFPDRTRDAPSLPAQRRRRTIIVTEEIVITRRGQ